MTLACVASGCVTNEEPEVASTSDEAELRRDVPGPHWKVLDVNYQVQFTECWCGPAATRVAISARRPPPSQGQLAAELGTTVNGTDYIGQVTRDRSDIQSPTSYPLGTTSG